VLAVGDEVAAAGRRFNQFAARQGDGEQISVEIELWPQEQTKPASSHELRPVAVRAAQPVRPSGDDEARPVPLDQTSHDPTAVLDQIGVVDEHGDGALGVEHVNMGGELGDVDEAAIETGVGGQRRTARRERDEVDASIETGTEIGIVDSRVDGGGDECERRRTT